MTCAMAARRCTASGTFKACAAANADAMRGTVSPKASFSQSFYCHNASVAAFISASQRPKDYGKPYKK